MAPHWQVRPMLYDVDAYEARYANHEGHCTACQFPFFAPLVLATAPIWGPVILCNNLYGRWKTKSQQRHREQAAARRMRAANIGAGYPGASEDGGSRCRGRRARRNVGRREKVDPFEVHREPMRLGGRARLGSEIGNGSVGAMSELRLPESVMGMGGHGGSDDAGGDGDADSTCSEASTLVDVERQRRVTASGRPERARR